MATIPELQRKLPARRQMRHDGLEVDNDKENMKVAFSSATTSAVPAQARPLEEPTPPTLGLCECCYDELPFEQDNFVQCSRGHLFGMSCLKNHANAQAFGKLSSQLPCMASNENCTAEFPPNAIQQLPAKTQSTLTVLEARESVLAAKLQNIEECPSCACFFQCDPRIIFPTCPNSDCKHAFCKTCRKDRHVGLSCEQLQLEQEEQARSAANGAADAMTEATVRECPNPNCRVRFRKSGGCNTMTCSQCKTISCYLCRIQLGPQASSAHFCQVFRCPRTNCAKCHVFDDSEEIDRAARRQAAEEALRQVQGEAEAAAIHALLSPQAKDPPEPMAVRSAAIPPRALPIAPRNGRVNGNPRPPLVNGELVRRAPAAPLQDLQDLQEEQEELQGYLRQRLERQQALVAPVLAPAVNMFPDRVHRLDQPLAPQDGHQPLVAAIANNRSRTWCMACFAVLLLWLYFGSLSCLCMLTSCYLMMKRFE